MRRIPIRFMRRYGGGCADLFVGPYMLSVIYRRNSGKFGWFTTWSRPRIWLAKMGVVFGRWEYYGD